MAAGETPNLVVDGSIPSSPANAPVYPFTTDGCSGLFMRCVHAFWRLTERGELSRQVTALCEVHDHAYHRGGSAADRVAADAALMVGVARLGQPVLSRLMVLGVGVGGGPCLPLPWRWGYGFPWPLAYTR